MSSAVTSFGAGCACAAPAASRIAVSQRGAPRARSTDSMYPRPRTRRCGVAGVVPRQRLSEAGARIERRHVAQQAMRLADVGLRMTDITGAKLRVDRRRNMRLGMSAMRELAQDRVELVQRHPPAGRNVV